MSSSFLALGIVLHFIHKNMKYMQQQARVRSSASVWRCRLVDFLGMAFRGLLVIYASFRCSVVL